MKAYALPIPEADNGNFPAGTTTPMMAPQGCGKRTIEQLEETEEWSNMKGQTTEVKLNILSHY